MSFSKLPLLMLAAGLLLVGSAAAGDLPELAFEKYTLDNGLEVILHRDSTIPVAAVNIWYHVGSKNEKPGRTGFAHLFEHMMFQGSKNHDTDYFLPLQKIGGQVNGSTNKDRTNYWENVPSNELELALFLEADRMGYLLPAMTQEKLDNQRDVVKNEKRQGENQPYAKSRELLLNLMYPADHPYRWTVIGSMDDLSAASKEDISEFFELYYAPNNASLCVAGDFDPEQAKKWIAKYFGPIPPGQPVDRYSTWIPVLVGERRAIAEDAVELPRVYMQWHTPGWYQPGDAEFDLLGTILTSGKTSRLYQSLVYEKQIAQDVNSFQSSRELGGVFGIVATAAPGHTLAELEAAIDEELSVLRKKGVSAKEVDLARVEYEAGFVRGLQRVGGFGGKADRLNRYNVYTGDPGYIEKDLERYYVADAKSINAFVNQYLKPDARAVLQIVPQGDLAAVGEAVETTELPAPAGDLVFQAPEIQTATLDNGLKLYLVEKRELPLVEARLNIMSGWSADPAGKLGTASMCADMLDEGVKGKDALEISAEVEALGANLRTGSSFDGTFVSLNVLKSQVAPGLALMSDVALRPTFPESEFERIKDQYRGRQQQESVQPMSQAIKEFQVRVAGAEHPYAQPYTGSGTSESLDALNRQDLVDYHATWFQPSNAALVLVGDLSLDEAINLAQSAFKGWQGQPVPKVDIPPADSSNQAKFVVIDRPDAQQSYIVGGYLDMTRNDPDYLGFQVMNTAFGGQFASRINLNLREDKGYTYGVRSQLMGFRYGGIFLITAPVQTPSTKESLIELAKEMNEIRADRPVSSEELVNSQNRMVMGFPQQFQTYGGVAGALGELLQNGLPLDDWQTYEVRVTSLDEADIAGVVDGHLDPDRVVWIIVGDWEVIGPGLEELGWGEIEVVRRDRS